MKRSTRITLCGALALGLALLFGNDTEARGRFLNRFSSFGGAVYTATNDADHNRVIVFQRGPTGRLSRPRTYATGGAGTGGGLGNQGGLTLDAEGRFLFVVNAGSDTVSVFEVRLFGLTLVDMEPSGGEQPISVTSFGDLLYVLNAGGDGNISGFEVSPEGKLSPLAGSTRSLGAAGVGPAQVGFTPDGRALVVTEKAANNIVTYLVGDDGVASEPITSPSEGQTPFGFSFSPHGRLLVSEAWGGAAGASTVSSYEVRGDGTLDPVTPALATTQSAACWLVATRNGRNAYITNTGSHTVTGLTVARDGALGLLDEDGVTAAAGSGPIDAALSRDGRYLYVLNGGDASLSAYRVRADGSLGQLAGVGHLPEGTNGLAAQ